MGRHHESCFIYGGGVCTTVLIAGIVTSIMYAKNMGWYNTQLEATCNDNKDASGYGFASVSYDTRRRRGVALMADYSCTFNVEAVVTSTQAKYSNLFRYAYNVYTGYIVNSASDRPNVERLCKSQYSWDGTYNCYVQESSTDIRTYKTGYPEALLIGMCVSWSIFGLVIVLCFLCFFKVSLPSSIVCPTCPVVASDSKVAPDAIGNELRDAASSAVADTVPFKQADLGKFRLITAEDLCDELIPGLMLRVQWPPCGPFKRWYTAAAVGYFLTPAMITFQYNDMAIFFRKSTLSLSEERVRFHENALSQVAKRRIVKKAVEGSIFGGLTFSQLDTDCSGSLNPQEVSAGLTKHGIYLDQSTLDSLVNLLDKDGNGKVDAAEFKKFLTKSDWEEINS